MAHDRLKLNQWQNVDSHVGLTQIGVVIFKDMLEIAQGYVEAYQGDHFHDAKHLIAFEQRVILKIAERDRDWFSYKCGINWFVRPTGTDYSDDEVNRNIHHAFTERNPLWVRYQVWPNFYDEQQEQWCKTIKVKRIIERAPKEWNLATE